MAPRVCVCLVTAVEACPVHRGDHVHAELVRVAVIKAARRKTKWGVLGWLRRRAGL